jgi:hypothetical protein
MSLPTRRLVSAPQARTTVKMQPCLVMVSVATLSCHLYRTKSSLLAHPSRTKPYLYRQLQSVSVLCSMVICIVLVIGGARARLRKVGQSQAVFSFSWQCDARWSASCTSSCYSSPHLCFQCGLEDYRYPYSMSKGGSGIIRSFKTKNLTQNFAVRLSECTANYPD